MMNVPEVLFQCLGYTWFLCADLQMFLFSPILAFGLTKHQKKTLLVIGLFIVCFQVSYLKELLDFKGTKNWATHYVQTQYQASKYLIGVVTGFIIYKNEKKQSNFKRRTLILGWFLSISTLLMSIFGHPKEFLPKFGKLIYDSIRHEIFAVAICWIIFACHNLKSGGYLRSFLSYTFWQPISKLCLSIYLVHFIYIGFTMDYGKVFNVPGLGWLIHISIGDIIISSLIALIFHLFVEAPLVKIIDLFCKKKFNQESKKTNQKINVV